LRALEEWFVSAVTTPETGFDLDADAAQLMTSGPKQSAGERLDVYRGAYRARLVECLADDYPALQFALGDESFEALCHAYIARHPSSSPSLNFFGRHMAQFCQTPPCPLASLPLADFAADLAALEWALVEVLHSRVADALSPETLAGIPVERWVHARLPPSDAVRLIRARYPVNAFFQSWKRHEHPEVPPAAPSATAVYRTELTLWRMDLTPAMTTILVALFAGRTLGEALAELEGTLDEAEAGEAERSLMVWFREWVLAGLFARVELVAG
jgi:hypothetical protein